MVFVPDPIVILNLILCIVILAIGCAAYWKSRDINALLIGIAFGLFGLTHLNTLLGLSLFPDLMFAILRLCGYFLVAAALYRYFRK
jgi:CHASE2 domain-containing sensor protein